MGLAENCQKMIKLKGEAIAVGVGAGSGTGSATPRTKSPPKISKPFRIGLLAMASVVGVWFYWIHLQGLTHVRDAAALATTAPAGAKTAAAATTAAAQSEAAPAAKSSTRDQISALWAYLLQSVKAAPVAAPVAAAKPQTAPTAAADSSAQPVVAAAAVKPAAVAAPKPLTEQDRLLQAARLAFQNVMDQASAYPDSYGFQPNDVLQNARLGGALPVYTVAQEDCANYHTGQQVKSMLKPADQWVFPVSMGDRICCMIQVTHEGHNYVPGGGNKMLGLAWNRILQTWPAAQGYHPQIVINANVPGYYFTVPELPDQNMTDIVRMFDYAPDLSPANVILASWR